MLEKEGAAGTVAAAAQAWRGVKQMHVQRRELLRQAQHILGKLGRLGRIEGLVCVGDVGKLVLELQSVCGITGKAYVVNDENPDAGTTPFRSEKNSNWEGAYRVPAFVRWPGKFPAGTTLNGIVAHEDWLPTFAAAAGEPAIKQKLAAGLELGGRTYRNYIDGYDQLDYLSGTSGASPRNEFFYVNDDGQIVAIRYSDWKTVFLENRGRAFEVWREPFTELRVPLLFNLRRDPFEKSQHNATTYNDWMLDHAFVAVPLQQIAGRFLMTMKDYPPSQTPGSFNLDKIQKQLEAAAGAR